VNFGKKNIIKKISRYSFYKSGGAPETSVSEASYLKLGWATCHPNIDFSQFPLVSPG
jgi:hypothetical protein